MGFTARPPCRHARRPPSARRSAALAAGIALLVGACGGGTDVEDVAGERASQARQIAEEAGLDDEVTEVLVDLARGVAATYRVTYDVMATGSEPGTLTVVQDPPRRRLEIAFPGSPRRVIIEGDGTTVSCVEQASEWSCAEEESPSELGPFADPDVERTIRALADAKASYDLTVERREIAGVPARCLVTTLRPGADDREGALGGAATICTSDDGLLLLAERPTGTIRAVEVGTDVAESSFDPPG